MTGYNLANIFETVALRFPEAPALLAPDGAALSWHDFDRVANAVAAALANRDLASGDRVAIMLRNQPEYLQACFAAFKLGLLPVNVNYRYTAHELSYLFDTAGVRAVIAGDEFADELRPLAATMALRWVWVSSRRDDIEIPSLPAASDRWADLVDEGSAASAQFGLDRRSPDDRLLLFTGGTTGLPKGVVWRQDTLLRLTASFDNDMNDQPSTAVDEVVSGAEPGERLLPAAPFMHGTGLFTSLGHLAKAGAVVCLPARSFDASRILDALERCAVTTLAIVGNGQAAPLVEALESAPDRVDLPALRIILSSGAALSRGHKERLLAAIPAATVVETLGASEGTGTGTAIATAGHIPPTGRFTPGPHVILLDADDHVLPLFGGETGVLAVGGPLPDGYFRDDAATARVYRTIGGERYAVPGDWARGHSDGTIELLGRGDSSINTGGEKVYASEVEAALLAVPGVQQVCVVGVPDERLGELVCTLLVLDDATISDDDLRSALRQTLAGYKTPRQFLRVADLPKTTTGKVDYAASRRTAVELLSDGSGGNSGMVG